MSLNQNGSNTYYTMPMATETVARRIPAIAASRLFIWLLTLGTDEIETEPSTCEISFLLYIVSGWVSKISY